MDRRQRHHVAFIQYMPAKPIKHGIKVFCVCCAILGIMLAYEVYCGNKDKKTDGTAVDVCNRLVKEAELTAPRGQMLYTDNYYMSMKLVKHLFEKYRWTMVGTIVPTDKKTREDHDIPFLKLSNGARNGLERGWFREACLKLQADRTPYYVQCTTWKDKKQVSFFQPTTWDGVMVCLSRGAYEANVRVILLRLHEHKLIMFQITMPWTETIGIALTT
jgi:hypothetical protein